MPSRGTRFQTSLPSRPGRPGLVAGIPLERPGPGVHRTGGGAGGRGCGCTAGVFLLSSAD